MRSVEKSHGLPRLRLSDPTDAFTGTIMDAIKRSVRSSIDDHEKLLRVYAQELADTKPGMPLVHDITRIEVTGRDDLEGSDERQ
jgi:hypothetical protein